MIASGQVGLFLKPLSGKAFSDCASLGLVQNDWSDRLLGDLMNGHQKPRIEILQGLIIRIQTFFSLVKENNGSIKFERYNLDRVRVDSI
jgi:hypothetical protein